MQELEQTCERLRLENDALKKESQVLVNHKSLCEQAIKLRTEQCQAMEAKLREAGLEVPLEGAAGAAPQPLHDTSQGALPAASVDQTAALAAAPIHSSEAGDRLVAEWKDTVTFVSSTLVDNTCSTADAVAKVEAKMTEMMQKCSSVIATDADAMLQLLAAQLHPEAAPSNHWQEVLDLIKLRDDQKYAILQYAQNFQATLESSELQRLTYAGYLRHPLDHRSSLLHASACRRLSLSASQITRFLRMGVETYLKFVEAVLDKVFDKPQLAQACVKSFPLFPDPLAMAAVLAGQAGLMLPEASPHPGVPSAMATQLLAHPAFQQLQQTATQQQQPYEAPSVPPAGEPGQEAPALEEGQQ